MTPASGAIPTHAIPAGQNLAGGQPIPFNPGFQAAAAAAASPQFLPNAATAAFQQILPTGLAANQVAAAAAAHYNFAAAAGTPPNPAVAMQQNIR